jgi:hypothetical protein
MIEEIKEESSTILRSKAEKCIDVLNNFRDDLFETIKMNSCLEEQMECLKKLNIFSEGAELLREVFNIEANVKDKDKVQ